MTDNLLDPIKFDSAGEAGNFAKRHVCALCQANLMYRYHSWEELYSVYCPNCGACYPHNVINQHTADEVKQNERMGKLELHQPRKNVSTDDILKELGF